MGFVSYHHGKLMSVINGQSRKPPPPTRLSADLSTVTFGKPQSGLLVRKKPTENLAAVHGQSRLLTGTALVQVLPALGRFFIALFCAW